MPFRAAIRGRDYGGALSQQSVNLDTVLAALRRDYAKLAPRIRELQHEVTCESAGVNLRLHFPAFRQAKATVDELTEIAWQHLTPFALTRREIDEVRALEGVIPFDDLMLKITQLNATATKLFIKANKATNRNGEAGELLLFLLTEWILGAPQIIAKMTLKTNPQMPVHGADGVHVKYCPDTERLFIYWGEAKMYADVGAAITSAATSIAKSLEPDALGHELQLVQRNIDFASLGIEGKTALLRYLDPYEEKYNERIDIITCLIGFDFDGFQKASMGGPENAEQAFRTLAKTKLAEIAPDVAGAINAVGLGGRAIEFFFFPLPAVQEFRNLFQARIGWTP